MINMRQTFANTVTDLAQVDQNIVIMVADISHGIFGEFREKIKNRYYNIGICEPAIVNMAAGLNKVGINPIVHTIAPFLITRSFEQIKLDFGYQNLNINLVSVGGSFDYTKLGCSHHSYEEVAILKHFARAQIFLPGSNIEFETLFRQHYKDNKINYFRITEYPHEYKIDINATKKIYSFKIRDGKDLTIVALGNQLKNAIKVAEILVSEYGIESDIVYFNSIKPFEAKIFMQSISKNKKFICIEELSQSGGLYEECLKESLKIEDKIRSEHVSITDFIHDYGSYDQLSEIAGLSVKNIIQKAKNLLKI
jgi:transketolase